MRRSLLVLLLVLVPLAAAHAGPAVLDPRQPGFWKTRPRTRTRPLIVGSAALDTIETPDGQVRRQQLGGSAVYASVAAGKATRPLIVAPIGRDFPARYETLLEQSNVDTKGLQRSALGESFAWSGRYLDSKDRVTVDTKLGVLGDFEPELPSLYRPRFVFLANMAPGQQQQVLDQLGTGTRKGTGTHTGARTGTRTGTGPGTRKYRPRVIVDTMNLWIEHDRPALERVIKQADLLLLNDEEAPMLAGTRDPRDLAAAARRVLEMGPKMVIVKQGKGGATLFYPQARGGVRVGGAGGVGSFSVPVYPVTAVDTTGAGDSFGGALLSYLARTGSFSPRAVGTGMVFASAVASSTVESFSVDALRKLSPDEITRRFNYLAGKVDLAALDR